MLSLRAETPPMLDRPSELAGSQVRPVGKDLQQRSRDVEHMAVGHCKAVGALLRRQVGVHNQHLG